MFTTGAASARAKDPGASEVSRGTSRISTLGGSNVHALCRPRRLFSKVSMYPKIASELSSFAARLKLDPQVRFFGMTLWIGGVAY